MPEQEKTSQVEKKKNYHSWSHYFRLGLTAFLTVAASITFYFILERWDVIAEIIGKFVKSAESVIIGLALAYLLMPVKEFIEKPVKKFLLSKKIKEEKAKNAAKAVGITGAIVFLFIIIAILSPP